MRKITAIILTIVCLIVVVSGCGNAPAQANETQNTSETVTPQQEQTVTPEVTESPEVTETPEVSEVPDAPAVDYEISRWRIVESNGSVCLEHQNGVDRSKDVEVAYTFDSGSGIDAEYCTIMDMNETEDVFLLRQHRRFFTLDLNKNELTCIVDGFIDFDYNSKYDELKYIDLEFYEYLIKWTESVEPEKTNVMLVAYFGGSYWAERNEKFKDRFKEIQKAVKNGTDPETITDVEITENGDIYDLNGKYLGNVHLPYPFDYSPNLQFYVQGMVIMVNETNLEFYRYGEIVQQFALPEGFLWWRVIGANVNYNVDPNELYANNVSAEEIQSAISDIQVLLYNKDERSVWRIDSTGTEKVDVNVADVRESEGVLYWVDISYKPHTLNWMESTESTTVGSEVVSVTHFTDEPAGFIVQPGDSRANAEIDGIPVYIP